jgi:hypothetical protein
MKVYLGTAVLSVVLSFALPTFAQQPTEHAFIWGEKSGMKDLGSLGGSSYGEAVNASGQVAGYFVTNSGDLHAWHARPGHPGRNQQCDRN